MKLNYCSRCNRPTKKLFNCKYEEHEEDWFYFVLDVHLSVETSIKKHLKINLDNLFQ